MCLSVCDGECFILVCECVYVRASMRMHVCVPMCVHVCVRECVCVCVNVGMLMYVCDRVRA